MTRPVPENRIFIRVDANFKVEGDYVLYWMQMHRRLHYNFGLQHAMRIAQDLGRPLLIYEGLRPDYPFASPRYHSFILDGMAEHMAFFRKENALIRDADFPGSPSQKHPRVNAAADKKVSTTVAAKGNTRHVSESNIKEATGGSSSYYLPFVPQTKEQAAGFLKSLGERACAVISDEFPVFIVPEQNARLAAYLQEQSVPFHTVDSNGIIPLQESPSDPYSAYLFRKILQKKFSRCYQELPVRSPLSEKVALSDKIDTGSLSLESLGITDKQKAVIRSSLELLSKWEALNRGHFDDNGAMSGEANTGKRTKAEKNEGAGRTAEAAKTEKAGKTAKAAKTEKSAKAAEAAQNEEVAMAAEAAKSEEIIARKNELLKDFPLDFGIPAILANGTRAAALNRMQAFIQSMSAYESDRNNPDAEATSGLSPYLHFGKISAHELVDKIFETYGLQDAAKSLIYNNGSKGFFPGPPEVDSFLDEALTWRETGYHFCYHRKDYDKFDSLPDWARKTLLEHRSDERPYLYSLEKLEAAQTHDEIWNAAQRELKQTGRIHNYLRMLWGKKILEWSKDPREALEIALYLNNKYSIDGRNPNSYSGVFWVFGRFDRPWQERPIFGKIRYMSSEQTRKKLQLKNYLQRFGPQQQGRLL